MAYQYRGKLTGENDPWNEPADPYQEREKLPRGVIRKDSGRYEARAKQDGKYLYNGTYDTPEEAGRAAEVLRARIKEANPNYMTLKPCGTNAAYSRHRRNGEKPCPACTRAATQYVYNIRKPKAA